MEENNKSIDDDDGPYIYRCFLNKLQYSDKFFFLYPKTKKYDLRYIIDINDDGKLNCSTFSK